MAFFTLACLFLGVSAAVRAEAPTGEPPVCSLDDPAEFSDECPPPSGSSECELPPRTCSFMNKGLGGGATKHHCENTIDSAEEALKHGANVLEVDVCKSSDGVLFLWFDCQLGTPLAIARRMGQFLSGKCVPWVHPNASSVQNADSLTWEEIQARLGYSGDWCVRDRLPNVRIPTLKEFLWRFSTDERVHHFNLDVKIQTMHVKETTRQIWRLANCLGVSSKIVVGFDNPQRAALGQCGLHQVGGDPREVSIDFDLALNDFGQTDTVLVKMKQIEGRIRDTLSMVSKCPALFKAGVLSNYMAFFNASVTALLPKLLRPESPLRTLNPVNVAALMCARYANVGIVQIPEGYEYIKNSVLKRSLCTRDNISGRESVQVSVFGARGVTQLAELISLGVDGIGLGQAKRTHLVLKTLKAGGCGWTCSSGPRSGCEQPTADPL